LTLFSRDAAVVKQQGLSHITRC